MGVAVKKIEKPGQDAGTPQSFEDAVASSLKRIEETLRTLPPEKLQQAKKEVDKLLQGDLSWADLSQYTPEKLIKIAETGYGQFKLGQYESAEKIFKGLTAIDPENYYYHQMLGATYQRKERYPEAVVEYAIAFDLNPKDIVSIANRGEVYFKLGIYELANADFDSAIGLDSKGDDKWANRARMLREQVRLVKKRGK